MARLGDERLALLVTPNRRVLSMLQYSRTRPTTFDERIDFAVEAAGRDGDRVVRVAVDLDESTGASEAGRARLERAAALEAEGWTVVQAAGADSPEADAALDLLVRALRTAVPDALVRAADDLRALPDDQRCAVEDLVHLPLAEAQITGFVAEALFRFRSADLLLANPLHLDLGPVVAAVTEALEGFRAIHRLPDPGRLRLAFTGEFADATYFALPSIDAWDAMSQDVASTIAPSVTAAGYVPPLSGAGPRAVAPAVEDRTDERGPGLRYLLQNVFRKVEFRPGQVEIIERALALRPVVGLLPTAAGKSLCYQLATFAQPGVTLVVAPLAALMQDQQDNLRAFGIHRTTAIPNAMLMREDGDGPPVRQTDIEAGEHLFVFVAPERLQMPDFRDYVQAMTAYVPVTYCVIDEAHCASEWGHDFRLSYLNVAPQVRRYCQHDGLRPSLIALTGTASRNVVVDILRELDIEDPGALVRATSFDRSELDFEIYQVPAQERLAFLAGKLRSVLDEFGWQPGQPG
ncbi:MAG: DEAD/DEAH box helicase, partial [Acidobacteria bacterium]|nr:DEAD/DEAH box helicase [Acidobacteriota bacterium]